MGNSNSSMLRDSVVQGNLRKGDLSDSYYEPSTSDLRYVPTYPSSRQPELSVPMKTYSSNQPEVKDELPKASIPQYTPVYPAIQPMQSYNVSIGNDGGWATTQAYAQQDRDRIVNDFKMA
jgi:hypothetical protein